MKHQFEEFRRNNCGVNDCEKCDKKNWCMVRVFFTCPIQKRSDRDYCAICQDDVDHDGYAECESCHKFYCFDHSDYVSFGLCHECAEYQWNKGAVGIANKTYKELIA
jgi:hypothetical protein